jgi:hypothetical protein
MAAGAGDAIATGYGPAFAPDGRCLGREDNPSLFIFAGLAGLADGGGAGWAASRSWRRRGARGLAFAVIDVPTQLAALALGFFFAFIRF